MIAVSDGLGFRILEAHEYMRSDRGMAGMITIGLLGLVIDIGVSRLSAQSPNLEEVRRNLKIIVSERAGEIVTRLPAKRSGG